MNLVEYRHSRLDMAAAEGGYDLLVASLPANIDYISGYHSVGQDCMQRTQAYVLYVPVKRRIIYAMGYAELPSIVECAGLDAEIFCCGGFRFSGNKGDALSELAVKLGANRYASNEEALAAAIKATGAKKVALDESRVNQVYWQNICKACGDGITLEPGTDVFMKARFLKHPDEIAGIERSTEIAERSLLAMLDQFQIGMTEHDLQQIYIQEVLKRGADPLFFVGTAAKRAAYSDTINTGLRIGKGDMIRFDFGCLWHGYCSDLARTATVGAPEQKVADYYHAIVCGVRAGIAAVKPGAIAEDVFKAAMDATIQNGLPHYERHHCGHGIGIELYDSPSIAPGDKTPLQEQMTLCIETPYYELGWGGIQIEDTIEITKDGARYLDKTGDDLIVLDV